MQGRWRQSYYKSTLFQNCLIPAYFFREILRKLSSGSFNVALFLQKRLYPCAYRGHLFLTFYRNVGCPICNLRFHEVQQEAAYFQSKNLIVLAVYESTAENMRTYLEGETPPYAVMLPNPEKTLYQLYGIERNKGKIFKSIFRIIFIQMKFALLAKREF